MQDQSRRKALSIIAHGTAAAGLGLTTGFNQPPVLAQGSRKLKGYLRTNWGKDPFSYGSYSHLAAGSGNADRDTVVDPIGNRVFFAGEALNPNYQSTVHAAYESGLLAAHSVLDTDHREIAVIGAGISGLAAAHELSMQGRNVTVWEGRNRIGGRIWTDRSLGAAVDLGATWIHGPKGNPITTLADKAELRRVVTRDDSVIRAKNGRRISPLLAPFWISQVQNETAMGVEYDKVNVQEMEAAYSVHGSGYEGQDVLFPNGYDQILSTLEGNYTLHLSRKVTAIDYCRSGVSIKTGDSAATLYDAVIVTVSLGVLKKGTIAFNPPLSAKKADAIRRMGKGYFDKLYLLFEDVFWDEGVTWITTPENGLARGRFNYWVNLKPYVGLPILLAINGGSSARILGDDTDRTLLELALKTLNLAYPM